MTTTATSPFEGFDELLRNPLEKADPRSFSLVQKLLDTPDIAGCPFSLLIKALSGIVISPREARNHWKKILEHKRRIEAKLSRNVNIRAAVIDYYDQLGVDAPAVSRVIPETDVAAKTTANAPLVKLARKAAQSEALPERIATPGFYQERLKEEMLRARRYKHALSVLMLYVDLQAIDAALGDKVLSIIVKIINRAVRTVDILGRHANDAFLLVLPNTNKREAMELADRLKKNIAERTSRLQGLATGVPLAIALGQCSKDVTAADFIKRLENLAAAEKPQVPAAISVLE
jgi:diguanylate cyclase (GGDEF)-like protein